MKPSILIGQKYTGPFVSNDKFQKSVAFGDQAPVDELDSYSRLHDTAYAYYGPGINRKAADSLYHERVSKLPGQLPSLAGDAVLYGNAGLHSLGNLVNDVGTGFKFAGLPGALGGLIYGAVENMTDLYQYMTENEQAKKKILGMERTDPHPEYQLGPQEVNPGNALLKGIQLPTTGKGVKRDLRPIEPSATDSARPGPADTSASVIEKPPLEDGTVDNSVFYYPQRLGGGEIKAMVKKQAQKKKTKTVIVQVPKAPKQRPMKARPASGAITSINTAPVAIGNSIRGSESIVVAKGKNGILLRGRDFMFGPVGTGSVVTWTCCGGTPLSPAAFADTTISTYMRLYAKFRFKSIVVHYITSSPTSANGDVMFYYGKDRSSVFLNQTSSQLLGFVLSDPNTVIGPQWTNHSAAIKVTGDWKLTDYGMHDGIEEYADGELFLLSKTSTTDSPGYVLFDYEIEFAEHQLQPRLLNFPIPRIQWFNTQLGQTTQAATSGDPVLLQVQGNNISGTSAVRPTGYTSGDIYKIFFDITNSNAAGWTNCTVNNLFKLGTGATSTPLTLTLTDGFTCYAVYTANGLWQLYENPTQAYSAPMGANTGIVYGTTATLTFSIQVWVSLIGTLAVGNMAPNY